MNDILDMHTHTIASGHAYNTIREMALAAKAKGLEILGIAEHAPNMPGTCHPFYFYNLEVIDRTAYGIELFLGAELNILDEHGTVDLPEELLERIDYCIASFHEMCCPPTTKEQNTRALINAMKNPMSTLSDIPIMRILPWIMKQWFWQQKNTMSCSKSITVRCVRPATVRVPGKIIGRCSRFVSNTACR